LHWFITSRKVKSALSDPFKDKAVITFDYAGVTTTENKERYAVFDASREAKKLNIPFTGIADPLGQGIFNAFQIFSYAEQQNKELDFIKSAFKAIYVDGLDLSNKSVIESLCQQHKINYLQALEYNNEHDWQQWSDTNQSTLDGMGLWGAPCFRFQNVICWGQDRLAQIEQAIIVS
ncbi:DsbA family protein, partial [Colwellia sp. BRX8-6]|uniref:DsbA family protein n=1 Tax=Colwellia sp. BRX8-6 TaxID=2759834 RepID=UPI0015F5D737